jgi:hypothetical protein
MKTIKILLTTAVLLIAANISIAEQAEPMKLGFSTDYYSKYIWRGQNLNNRDVIQPSIYASKWGLTGAIWGSYDLTNHNGNQEGNAGDFTEFDFSLDYSNTIPDADWLGYSVGVIYYRFPCQVYEPTTEVYGGLSLSKVPLTPSLKIYRDVDEIKGTYYQFSIGHTIEKIAEMGEGCTCGLSLGASTGYGNSAYNTGYALSETSGGKMNDLTLTAGLPICFGSWTLKPSINYATMLADTIRDATKYSDNIWGGLSLSCNF